MRLVTSSSLTGQNISASATIGSYTASALEPFAMRVNVSNVVGGATYTAWMELQEAGSATRFRSLSASESYAAGVTALYLQTDFMPVAVDEVVHACILGGSTDTNATVRMSIYALNDLATGAQMGLADNAITAAKISASALSNAKFATGAITGNILGASTISASNIAGSALDSTVFKADAIGAAVLAASAIGTSEFAQSAISAIWANSERTITTPATLFSTVGAGSTMNLQSGDSFSVSITGLGSLTDAADVWLVAKKKSGDSDDDSVLKVSSGSKLVRISGSTPSGSENGAVVIDNSASGNITISVTAGETDDINPNNGLDYRIKVRRTSGSVTTLQRGVMNVL